LIEYLMLITLGACGASLLWLALWPALSRRTERLARRRIEAALPMSVAEFAGERDQLRAALAVKEVRIEKRAEALAAQEAAMLAETGRAQARIAMLEEQVADESRRHGLITTEHARLNELHAETGASLEMEQRGHAGLRDSFAALEAAHRELRAGHENLADTAEQRRLETAALQAEREALLGRVEGLEAAHQSLRAERAGLAETADARHVENAVLKAEREAHLERLARADANLENREARLAELDELAHRRNVQKTEAEARAAETAIMARGASGPLHGIPIGLKDIVDTKGIPTTCGS